MAHAETAFSPFTAEDHAARMTAAVAAAAAAGLDGLLVTPGPDLVRLTGYQPTAVAERLTLLVLRQGAEPLLILPAFERADAEAAGGVGRVQLRPWADGEDAYAAAAALLEPRGRYAISDAAWAMHLVALQDRSPATRYASMSEALPLLRAVKMPEEMARMTAAAAAADAAFEGIVELAFEGRTELEVAGDLADLLLAHGHSRVEFALVGSGPNGANPHHSAGERVIQDGDTIVLDFGGVLAGYGSDITRTVHVGEPDGRVREVHEVVRRAQQAGVEAVRPGVACQDVDRATRAVIAEAGYGELFTHRTGHGIGLTVHEPPYIVEGETLALGPGMVFSVEPGIYLPGRFGVRIEDIVAVTDDGVRRLNAAPRELRIVG